MTVAIVIIEMALEKIGKHSKDRHASASEIARAVFPFHSMMSSWYMQGINSGIAIPISLECELNEPEGTRNAIILNLALHLATSSDDIPEWLVNLANWEFNCLEVLYEKKAPELFKSGGRPSPRLSCGR